MISNSASLPIVVIFERHWDEEPRQVIKDIIPKLANEGYDTLCLEYPQKVKEKEILSSHRELLKQDSQINSEATEWIELASQRKAEWAGLRDIKLCDLGLLELARLMRTFVSSDKYLEIAERIKEISANILLKDIFDNAIKYCFSLRGIDIDNRNIFSHNVISRMEIIEKQEDYRISAFFENVLNFYKEGKAVVCINGASHAKNFINKFKEHNMQDRVLYYFLHSTKNYNEGFDDAKYIFSNSYETLENHTFCLKNEEDKKEILERIIKEIKENNTNYKEEVVGGNSHSEFLSSFFKKDFKAFMRPGYYVDALLDIDKDDDSKHVIEKLQQVNIPTEKISIHERNYLVVRDINTEVVSNNIRRLK